MLKDSKTFTSFSAPDLDVIKNFYHEKLGLEILFDIDGAVGFKTDGDTKFMVYYKPNHEPALYTVLNFEVTNVENEVDELAKVGVKMEQYKEMGTNDKGISEDANNKMAWFLDPAGNIIALMETK